MRPSRALVPLLAPLVALVGVPAAEAAVVTGGQVDWGVKQSFRNYVMGPIAFPGSVTPSDGATQPTPAGVPGTGAGGGPFRFPVTGGAEPNGLIGTSAGSRGRVRFTGHAGALDFSIFNVRVVLDPPSANAPCVIADADAKKLNGGGVVEAYRNVRFAKLDTTGIVPVTVGPNTTWNHIPATLTAEGSPAFAGFYDPGTELDRVSLTYTKAAGTAPAAGSCDRPGSVVTVPPGGTPPRSTPARASVRLGRPSKGQLRLLARGKPIRTKVRVSRAGRVTLTAKGRIARKTRIAGKAAKRAARPGLVTLRWKLTRGARSELAKRGKLRLKLTAALPGAKPVGTRLVLRRSG